MSRDPQTIWILSGIAAIAAVTMPRLPDLLLYNHSPSIPVGFYVRIPSPGPIANGAIVTVRARDVAPRMAADRHFDALSDRFIKHVGARAGDRVCVRDQALFVNGRAPLVRRPLGAGYPVWNGCRYLETDEILLLGDTADSFDGRYWGPVRAGLIEGVWQKL